ncbi:Iron-chelator utilization protein [Minicystis rosea]|nr:Iron-chelator utilization protein [Minicystis rosea]
MPEMPAFLANVLEPRFARRALVTDVVDLAPGLRRVRFAGDALRGVSFLPGQEVEFRVSDRAFRHYTPSRFDAARGEMEIVFFLHGDGPGTTWARKLAPNDHANVLGPGGRFALHDTAEIHVFLGDETTLGLFAVMAQAAKGRVLGAVEIDAQRVGGATDEQRWPALVGLDLPAVERTCEARGDVLLRWIEEQRALPPEGVCFYLAGHTGSIVRMRDHLLQRGWSRRSIRTKAYWADGKRGL